MVQGFPTDVKVLRLYDWSEHISVLVQCDHPLSENRQTVGLSLLVTTQAPLRRDAAPGAGLLVSTGQLWEA